MTDEKNRLEEKKQRLLGALEQGMTQIHLDARRPGVIVPEQFRAEHHLVLNLSYRFDPPDLTVSDWGVRQTLSFSGSRFSIGVPWSALYAVASLVTREFWMYPDDMPVELADSVGEKVSERDLKQVDETDAPRPAPALAPALAPPFQPRAVLREVVLESPPGEHEGEAPKDPSPPRRGHLRVVK